MTGDDLAPADVRRLVLRQRAAAIVLLGVAQYYFVQAGYNL